MSTKTQRYYQDEWSSLKLLDRRSDTGWRTLIPATEIFGFLKLLKAKKAKGPVLDLGCGAGRYTLCFAENDFKAYGVDFSPAAIKIAKEIAKNKGLKINYRVGDVLNLPFKDSNFGIVNDDGCFHHIHKPKWKGYVKSISRVLKSGGYYRLKVFSNSSTYLKEKRKGKQAVSHDRHYTYFFREKELKGIFKDFQIVSLKEKKHQNTGKKRFFYLIAQKK